jgi:hypothetical protein
MDRYPPGGKDWKARRWYTGQRARGKQLAGTQLPRRNRCDNRDHWLEPYLLWLFHEAARLDGGSIARHYLGCAHAAYAEYCTSGDLSARYRSWLAIRTCAGWLAQLERGCSQCPH